MTGSGDKKLFGRERVVRLQLPISSAELKAIDDYRFQHRLPTRAAAIRELIKLGMTPKPH
jgi:hypothetical protein